MVSVVKVLVKAEDGRGRQGNLGKGDRVINLDWGEELGRAKLNILIWCYGVRRLDVSC